jgi:hypothetical protein
MYTPDGLHMRALDFELTSYAKAWAGKTDNGVQADNTVVNSSLHSFLPLVHTHPHGHGAASSASSQKG